MSLLVHHLLISVFALHHDLSMFSACKKVNRFKSNKIWGYEGNTLLMLYNVFNGRRSAVENENNTKCGDGEDGGKDQPCKWFIRMR